MGCAALPCPGCSSSQPVCTPAARGSPSRCSTRPHKSAMNGRTSSKSRSSRRPEKWPWCSGPPRPVGHCLWRGSTTASDTARQVWTRRRRETRCSTGNRCSTDTCCSSGPLRQLRMRSSGRAANVRPTGMPTPAHCHRHPLRRSEGEPNGGNGRPRRRSAAKLPRPPRRAVGAEECRTNASSESTGHLELARLDRDLVDRVLALDPATQRAIAIWASRAACAAAGLTNLDWVKSALAALERREPLPFDDLGETFRLLGSDPLVRRTTVVSYDEALTHFSATHGSSSTVVGRCGRLARGRARIPVPCDGHPRNRLPASPVRGALCVSRVGGR